MNTKRPIILIFSFSLILMGLLLMQRNAKPKIDGAEGENTSLVADATADEVASESADQNSQDESETSKNPDSPGESTQDDSTTGGDTDSDVPAIEASKPETFYTLGSMDPNSTDRYLVTATTHGGAIKRVESNFRLKRKNRLAYRDFEYKNKKTGEAGGYLGELELQDTDVGGDEESQGKFALSVRVVGPGTPAYAAGLQVGDAILSVDGEPVISKGDFANQLIDANPQDTIKLGIYRDGSETSLDVTLESKPIEIIRPEPDTFSTGMPSPESFLLNLRVPKGLDWPEIDPGMVNGNWEAEEVMIDGAPGLAFSYTISDAKMKAAGLSGPVKVTRSFWMPEVTEEARFDLAARNSHIKTRIKIENLSKQTQKLGYQINGPTGTPTEGWWYVNKIHGRPWAIGYMAGTRDVAASSAYKDYIFFGGPEIAKNVTKKNPIIQKVFHADDPAKQQMNYVGVDTQYFNVSLLPAESASNSEESYTCFSGIAALSGYTVPKKDQKLQRLVDCTFLLYDQVELEPGGTYSQDFDIFAGPKEPKLLETYGLDDNRTFGWFALFSKPLCWLLKVFYNMTGQFSYGLAIIMLTVLVRCCMIPISRKAAINAQMMQALQPQMKAIADKYKEDMEKRAQAQRELFRRHKYNPFGGCFLMFFQLPIFIGLYRGLSVDIALRDQPLIRGMNWCSNLAAPDQLYYWKDFMPSFLAGETGFLGPYFNLLPMFTIVLFLVQQKMFTPPATDDNQKMMQKMMTFMMFFMGILFFKVPAALCLYFITSSLWGIIERKMLPKPKLSEDKLSELGSESDVIDSPGASKSGASKSKGLFAQIKDAVEQNATGKSKPAAISAEEKKRLDKERKKKLKKRGS